MLIQNLSPQLQATLKNLPPEIAKKAIEFNFYPGRYVHVQHLTSTDNGLSDSLAKYFLQHRRSRERITDALFTSSHLHDSYNFEFSTPLMILALLDFGDILRIARIATLASHGSAASAFSDDISIEKFTNLVGESGLRYALENADTDQKLSLNLTRFLLTVETDTKALLQEWWAHLPTAVVNRATLKFPAGFFSKTTASSTGLNVLAMAASHFTPACITESQHAEKQIH